MKRHPAKQFFFMLSALALLAGGCVSVEAPQAGGESQAEYERRQMMDDARQRELAEERRDEQRFQDESDEKKEERRHRQRMEEKREENRHRENMDR